MKKVTLICNAGARRSAGITAWSRHLLNQSSDKNSFEIINAALWPNKVDREACLRLKRIKKCKSALNGKYAKEAEMFEKSGSTMHPRLGILMLSLGVNEVLEQRVHFAGKHLLEDSMHVLVAEEYMKDAVRENLSFSGELYTVKQFLNYPDSDFDIPDRHAWGTIGRKMRKDLEFCYELKSYAQQLAETLR